MIQAPKSPGEIATLAARIFAVDPWGTGICLRAGPGPARDEWLALLRALLPDRPFRKMPLGITDDRLLGGLDLSASLAAGRLVSERGLLAESDGGALIIPSAERLSPEHAARIASVHDRGEVPLERDGLTKRFSAWFGLVLLDEGLCEDEQAPASLTERIAMQVDLTPIRSGELGEADAIAAARECLPRVSVETEAIEAICGAATALGIVSVRAPLLALKVAKIAAALDGRDALSGADLAIAGQLVLGWRATRLPQSDEEQPEEDQQPDAPGDQPESETQSEAEALSEIVVEAVRAALPPDVLARLGAKRAAMRSKSSGQAGVKQRSLTRGRRTGIMQGDLRRGGRLDLVATLRAAAPWQRIRSQSQSAERPGLLQIRASDFRVIRFARKSETLTIFAVDASGSLALNRMAEAKGAVESLLAECYVRRDHVAMLVFGGKTSDLILPPTRSLVRAKRSLIGLPAGGGTPLASGIDAAIAVAQSARKRGQTPLIVLLTDGRANVARDGRPGRHIAHDHALASARLLKSTEIRSLLIDTSPRPDPRAAEIAHSMGASYLALPALNSAALSSAVKQARAR
ncbi:MULTISPECIES: magnesium chelatase subunit D [Rhodomicrobium]|uniref:magnesium chelatase subunit D n=1 Tax=Rhodomicrobium TaxID=1068 RepID=UPI001FD8A52A|nr:MULTISPECIES: magnesium chelatase subunit D [Rhodomicrobium]